MEVTVSISMDVLNDGDFDERDDYYKSDDEFFEKIKEDVDMNSDVAYEVVNNLGNLYKRNAASFESTSKNYRNPSLSIYKCSASLLDEENNDETVDGIISKSLSNDVVVSILRYNFDDMDEEFEEDLRLWVRDHESINEYIDKLGEDKVWENEPKRDFVVTFKNKANEDVSVQYINARIVGKIDSMTYAVLAEKLMIVEKMF